MIIDWFKIKRTNHRSDYITCNMIHHKHTTTRCTSTFVGNTHLAAHFLLHLHLIISIQASAATAGKLVHVGSHLWLTFVHPQSDGLGIFWIGDTWPQTWTAWITARRKCWCSAALVGGIFSNWRSFLVSNCFRHSFTAETELDLKQNC
jgi:hypothetical protein